MNDFDHSGESCTELVRLSIAVERVEPVLEACERTEGGKGGCKLMNVSRVI